MTSEEWSTGTSLKKIMKIHRQDSVPRPTVRAIVPQQARVPVSHKGIKRLSSSIELGAQHVSPHQTTKRKKTTPERRVPAFSQCLEMMSCSCKGCCKNGGFWQFEVASLNRDAFHWVYKGQQERQDISKKWQNRKANCCDLLR